MPHMLAKRVEELRFESPALAVGDDLRASVTGYPPGYESSGYCLRRNIV